MVVAQEEEEASLEGQQRSYAALNLNGALAGLQQWLSLHRPTKLADTEP